MTAKDILSPGKTAAHSKPGRTVQADMPLLELLPRLLDTPGREVEVNDGTLSLGVVDQTSLLEGLARMIAPRDDCSEVTIECRAEDYSASSIAHAVEDSDAHLVDMLSTPSSDGHIRVTLRLRHSDPSAAMRSLERHDFSVVEAHAASDGMRDAEIAAERLLALQTLLNV